MQSILRNPKLITVYVVVLVLFEIYTCLTISSALDSNLEPYNPCYGPLPLHYPNRLPIGDVSRKYLFVTTDSTTEILEFYRQTGPLPPPNAPTLALQDGYQSIFEFPSLLEAMKMRPEQSCGDPLIVSIHNYGLFRIVNLYYGQINVDWFLR